MGVQLMEKPRYNVKEIYTCMRAREQPKFLVCLTKSVRNTLSPRSVFNIVVELEMPWTGNYILSVSRNIFSISDTSNFQKREVTCECSISQR
jgi:hypothetical protein